MEQLTKSETIALREKHIGKACQLFFQQDPLKIVRGKGQYMYDERGEAYLDCINNVAHVGHCHPEVVKAGCEQMAVLNTNNRFLHDNIVLCARRLVSTMPGRLSVCFFVNSGSEANDLAIRMARIYTGNKHVIALEHAYHGHLTSLIDISHYKFNLPGGNGKGEKVHIASCPDMYRGKYRSSEHDAEMLGQLYAAEVGDICREIKDSSQEGVCAYIAESMLSCGGQVIPPQGYLQSVYKYVRDHGGVCIADEVQVGFGRVGKHWWAFEHQGVVPDIVTIGKPMGNGHPIAAVITTEEIARSFKNTNVGYFNTFGGNPVSCAIANAVFDTIERENLMENALVVGEYLMDACSVLGKRHKIIGDVRGMGLFVGIDLVKDRNTKEPDTNSATYVVRRMKEEHILVSADGPNFNVIKLKPPMVFTKENVDEFICAFDGILDEIKHQKKQYITVNGTSTHEHVSKDGRERKTIKEAQIKSI